jgi:hypothetical protein
MGRLAQASLMLVANALRNSLMVKRFRSKLSKRMNSYFARHEVDKQAEGFTQGEKGFPSPGRVAWDAWGGDAGKSWASNIVSNAKDKAMELGYGYAEITKADEQPDGTMIVYGKASDDTIRQPMLRLLTTTG